jgi:mono/diheme cytochrome c family protein
MPTTEHCDRSRSTCRRRATASRSIERLLVALLMAWGGASVTALRPGADTESPTAKSSVLDGVYTREQADRGKAQYVQYCSSCHRDDLSGYSTVPPLAGEVFMKAWAGRTVDDLYTVIRTGMPPYESTAISRRAYVDIVAFILWANAMPSGADELEPESAQLSAIVITKGADPVTHPR